MVLKTCVFSSMTLTYACETWVLTNDCRKKIFAFERKCYRKLLGISWTQKMTDKELYEKIGQEHSLLQTVIERKLQLFGHVCRMARHLQATKRNGGTTKAQRAFNT